MISFARFVRRFGCLLMTFIVAWFYLYTPGFVILDVKLVSGFDEASTWGNV